MNSKIKNSIKITLLLTSICSFLTSCGDEIDNYYSSISDDMIGEELLNELNNIIYHEKKINYANLGSYYNKTDSAGEANKIYLFYTNQIVSTKITDTDYMPYTSSEDDENGINREHVWCQSRFRIYGSLDGTYGTAANPGPATDLYNVRPCLGAVNVSRSNYFYGEDTYNLFDPASVNGGDESYRGDIARILFYVATRYEKLKLVDEDTAATGTKSYQMGKLSDLLKWNLEYTPHEREIKRNDVVYEIQGNRNPFVDRPEYACRIWGYTNDTTKSICKDYL